MSGPSRSKLPAMCSGRGAQRGVALVVSLVLLLVATLIGLASVRGTNLQERMSSNMYDRSLAFQRAESALRAAEDAITANWQISTLGGVEVHQPAHIRVGAERFGCEPAVRRWAHRQRVRDRGAGGAEHELSARPASGDPPVGEHAAL